MGSEIRGFFADRRQPRTERALAALGDEGALGPYMLAATPAITPKMKARER